jgi:hypothetical protein
MGAASVAIANMLAKQMENKDLVPLSTLLGLLNNNIEAIIRMRALEAIDQVSTVETGPALNTTAGNTTLSTTP